MRIKTLLTLAVLLVGGALLSPAADASHSWNGYHWARAANPFTLKVVDSVTPVWDNTFNNALNMWAQSTVLDLTVAGSDDSSKTRRRCPAIQGQIRVCNDAYGKNGWLGLATIGLDSNGHIDQGTAKMNDSYSSYFTPDEMNHVMCQEIGHTFGLDHQSTDGSSLGTCMDYSSDPNSQWPNAHDYEELEIIYSHLDTYNSYAVASSGGGVCHGKQCQASGSDSGAIPMGILVHRGKHSEIWVASRSDGGYWVHYILLAPGETHSH